MPGDLCASGQLWHYRVMFGSVTIVRVFTCSAEGGRGVTSITTHVITLLSRERNCCSCHARRRPLQQGAPRSWHIDYLTNWRHRRTWVEGHAFMGGAAGGLVLPANPPFTTSQRRHRKHPSCTCRVPSVSLSGTTASSVSRESGPLRRCALRVWWWSSAGN